MKWLPLTLLAIFAIGCCCQTPGQPAVDPFAGHMTVQPPPTGAIGQQQYYQAPPPNQNYQGPPPNQNYQGPPPGNQYYQTPPGGPGQLQPIPQTPNNPSYQYQQTSPPGNSPLQPIPGTPSGPMPGPGGAADGNSPRPGTPASWAGQTRTAPGDVITIPASQSREPLGITPGPAEEEPAAAPSAGRPTVSAAGPRSPGPADRPCDIADLPVAVSAQE